MRSKLLAELIGTYGLVFAGTGAIVINELYGGVIGHLGIAASFGLIVTAMIYAFGEISGAHINPAVTLAFWMGKKFPSKNLLPYLFAQFTGAMGASLTLYLLFDEPNSLGATMPSGSAVQSLILEFILSFFLMLVILRVSTGSKETGIMAGIAIGFTVGLEALFAGPVCGASMNPFRSLAPAMVSMNLQHQWLYILGPLAGMMTATVAFKWLQPKSASR
ncbi:aquaporin [Luteibaculum oceani]|uniref:Aquaporin n=1 Tax=Luteibaculum oceani TaxID=1294296 RepID=A0A5C6UUG5_9FLAO|nr:aquaporin [Luteibaculum oceani]TXC76270.1 aquaporin [Luteibaculum oceani]